MRSHRHDGNLAALPHFCYPSAPATSALRVRATAFSATTRMLVIQKALPHVERLGHGLAVQSNRGICMTPTDCFYGLLCLTEGLCKQVSTGLDRRRGGGTRNAIANRPLIRTFARSRKRAISGVVNVSYVRARRWNRELHLSARARRAPDGEPAADDLGALAHAA